jgi:hypothetical protein
MTLKVMFVMTTIIQQLLSMRIMTRHEKGEVTSIVSASDGGSASIRPGPSKHKSSRGRTMGHYFPSLSRNFPCVRRRRLLYLLEFRCLEQ